MEGARAFSEILASWIGSKLNALNDGTDATDTTRLAEQDFGVALAASAEPAPRLLGRLAEGLNLSAGEIGLIALCYSAETNLAVAAQIARLYPASAGRGVPVVLAVRLFSSFNIAMLSAGAPLRAWSIISLEPEALRVEAHVRLVEPILDRMLGDSARETAIEASFRTLVSEPGAASADLVAFLSETLTQRAASGLSTIPYMAMESPARIASALAKLGLKSSLLAPALLNEAPETRLRLFRAWARDAMLDGAVLIARIPEDPHNRQSLCDAIDDLMGHVALIGETPLPILARILRPMPRETHQVRRSVMEWQKHLGATNTNKLNGSIERVSHHFHLTPEQITRLGSELSKTISEADPLVASELLWRAASRAVAPRPLPAMRIVEPRATWDDIVLAPRLKATLERLEGHVRHAATVFGEWGFGSGSGMQGEGIAALFAGPSGTGKTLACEVLANALMLPLVVVNLSQLISKYVGETSKNIAAIFDEAERSGAVMVWNEGDAIWGARGAVSSATDRHVNAEVGDLLQRIEMFNGFTIVTTNLKQAIDTAFMRRFRFVVDFPLPGETERALIWQRVFPPAMPRREFDWLALASLPLAGGSIRNAALNAAFAAAQSRTPLDGAMLKLALAEELRKQERSLPPLELEIAP
jgi:hypothetical protein